MTPLFGPEQQATAKPGPEHGPNTAPAGSPARAAEVPCLPVGRQLPGAPAGKPPRRDARTSEQRTLGEAANQLAACQARAPTTQGRPNAALKAPHGRHPPHPANWPEAQQAASPLHAELQQRRRVSLNPVPGSRALAGRPGRRPPPSQHRPGRTRASRPGQSTPRGPGTDLQPTQGSLPARRERVRPSERAAPRPPHNTRPRAGGTGSQPACVYGTRPCACACRTGAGEGWACRCSRASVGARTRGG